MDFISAVNRPSINDALKTPGGYKTIDEALDAFESVYPQDKQDGHTINQPLANEAIHALHHSLQSYWSQFGILDKSTSKGFHKWVTNNINFVEYKGDGARI